MGGLVERGVLFQILTPTRGAHQRRMHLEGYLQEDILSLNRSTQEGHLRVEKRNSERFILESHRIFGWVYCPLENVSKASVEGFRK